MNIGIEVNMRYPVQWRTKSWAQYYQDEIDLIVSAEALGYDSCLVGQHHFVEPEEGHCLAPMTVCAALAARTSRMEIGTNLILPLADPVRVAEESATIDVISNGRFVLGLMQGYREAEYKGFGVSMRERGARLSEGTRIIRQCWTGERFSFDGRFWQYSDVVVDLPPVRTPPILYGSRTPAALRRAARDEVGVISQGDGVEACKIYATACRELGRVPGQVRHLRYVNVSDDPDKAWAELAPHALHAMQMYEKWMTTSPDVGLDVPQGDALVPETLRQSSMYLICTPEQAIDEINALKAEYPIDELWVMFGFPGYPHERVAEQLETFALRVMPHVR